MTLKNKKSLVNSLKLILKCFKKTPFHPQWFVYKDQSNVLISIAKLANGRVLDIGCGEKLIEKYVNKSCEYIGLDYYKTSKEWYGSKPNVFSDAQYLPFNDSCIDTILILDVLEHLPDPDMCLEEANRILVSGGSLVITVPFIYPIHDRPLDFNRWTLYGLRHLCEKYDFEIIQENINGNLLETSSLLINIAMCKTIINWVNKNNPLAILVLTLPVLIFLINILAWLFSCLSSFDGMMASGYKFVLKKEYSGLN